MALSSVLCRTATSILLLLAFVFPCAAAGGAGVGTVTHLSGPLFAKKGDGSTRTLAVKSTVEAGDTLITEKRTYGKVKFSDGGEVTLRPNTSFVVENYAFNKENASGDSAVFGLVKGSLRAVTGQVGKRGNQDAYKMKTHSATIGIRGTAYDLKVCEDNCPGLSNGIYFYVIEGMIEVTTSAGTKRFGVGQSGYVKDDSSMPVVLPDLPDLNLEIPPFANNGCGVR